MHFAVHLKQKIVNNYTSIIFFFKEFSSVPRSQLLAEIVTFWTGGCRCPKPNIIYCPELNHLGRLFGIIELWGAYAWERETKERTSLVRSTWALMGRCAGWILQHSHSWRIQLEIFGGQNYMGFSIVYLKWIAGLKKGCKCSKKTSKCLEIMCRWQSKNNRIRTVLCLGILTKVHCECSGFQKYICTSILCLYLHSS